MGHQLTIFSGFPIMSCEFRHKVRWAQKFILWCKVYIGKGPKRSGGTGKLSQKVIQILMLSWSVTPMLIPQLTPVSSWSVSYGTLKGGNFNLTYWINMLMWVKSNLLPTYNLTQEFPWSIVMRGKSFHGADLIELMSTEKWPDYWGVMKSLTDWPGSWKGK